MDGTRSERVLTFLPLGIYETYCRCVGDGSLIGEVAPDANPSLCSPEWISGADAYAASWVKDKEQELLKKDYWYV